jgi:cellulose synthase/poly-beta-1,6-N-acetylglucosamine synthase-like glycosyltransferase
VAPVIIKSNSSAVQLFQSIDFMVLQGITGASVHRQMLSMCNGANLAYERKAFQSVNGFSGIDHLASGDDMLLMYKIWKQHAGRVQYLKSKDVIVTTEPVKNVERVFQSKNTLGKQSR